MNKYAYDNTEQDLIGEETVIKKRCYLNLWLFKIRLPFMRCEPIPKIKDHVDKLREEGLL